MSQNAIDSLKNTSKQLAGKLQKLTDCKDDQKKISKEVKEIKRLKDNLEREFNALGSDLEKFKFNKQEFFNTTNIVKRVCNQPTEGNISMALNKMNNFITQLAA